MMNPYNWDDITRHLATLPDANLKIEYLVNKKYEYRQDPMRFVYKSLPHVLAKPFDELCDMEIEKIKEISNHRILEREKEKDSDITKLKFTLSNRKGAQTDLVRILNILYELKFFVDASGIVPTKENVMNEFGRFLDVDLKHFDKALSQGRTTQNLSATTKIFEEMIEFARKDYNESLEKTKKKTGNSR